MYFGVPKKCAAASACRPKTSSPNALGTCGINRGSVQPESLLLIASLAVQHKGGRKEKTCRTQPCAPLGAAHCPCRGPGCAGPSGGTESRSSYVSRIRVTRPQARGRCERSPCRW